MEEEQPEELPPPSTDEEQQQGKEQKEKKEQQAGGGAGGEHEAQQGQERLQRRTLLEPEPEPEPEPELVASREFGGLREEAVLAARCHKQKQKLRTWHERHARIVPPGLFFFASQEASADGVLEEPRGSSIRDVSGYEVGTGIETFILSESFPRIGTWFKLELKRHDLQGGGVTTLVFREEHVRDTFAAALCNLSAGRRWDAEVAPSSPPTGASAVVVRALPRHSLSFKFPTEMLEPVPVHVHKGAPTLHCAEDSPDPCRRALFTLGISSIALRDAPRLHRVIYSHRVVFHVTRPGNFEFTDAANETHTQRAASVGECTLDFNAEQCTITQVRRRTTAERRSEIRQQWPHLNSEVEVWSATANAWVAGVVESADADDVTVLYTVDGEKRGKVIHRNDRDHLRMRTDSDSASRADGSLAARSRSESSGAVPDSSDASSESAAAGPGRSSSVPDRLSSASQSSTMRFSWTTEDHVPEDPEEAFAALLPRLPENVTLQWLRQAGGGALYEGWLESEKLGYTVPVLGKMSRGGTGDWARWWCILWPREPNPDHGRLLVCFDEQDRSSSSPVEVIRLQDPCVLPPRNSREPYFALRLEAAQVKRYNPERADELRSSPGVALTGTSGPLLERRKKWILGLKDQRAMEAWVKHIPLHLPYLRKERMGWESDDFARQRSSPAPSVPVHATHSAAAGEDDDIQPSPTAGQLLQQVPSISGKLNDPAEWEELSSGGYGTVYRASWMGAPVAVKVLNQTKAATLPPLMQAWEPEKIRQVCEIVRQAGDSLMSRLRDQGINGLQVPGVVAYCRAITARSTHRQDFEKEAQTIYSVQHPFVVQCFGTYRGVSPLSQRDEVMLVMDVADRGSLWSFLRQPRSNGTVGPSLATRATIARGIASGIAFLHGGERPLVHLDLKSLNILISGDGRPKICDFGAAQPESDVADSSFTPGTGAWMAPEVALTATLQMPADIYSFGVILWELLTKENVLTAWAAASGHKPTGGGANIPFWANEGLRPAITSEYSGCRGWVLLIEDCWRTDAGERPTIEEIVQQRCALLERELPTVMQACRTATTDAEQLEPELEAELEPEPSECNTPVKLEPAPQRLDESITEVEAWLTSLGLGQYAQPAAESAEFCDIEDFEDLLEDVERWEECLAELGMTDDDAQALLRVGIARLKSNC